MNRGGILYSQSNQHSESESRADADGSRPVIRVPAPARSRIRLSREEVARLSALRERLLQGNPRISWPGMVAATLACAAFAAVLSSSAQAPRYQPLPAYTVAVMSHDSYAALRETPPEPVPEEEPDVPELLAEIEWPVPPPPDAPPVSLPSRERVPTPRVQPPERVAPPLEIDIPPELLAELDPLPPSEASAEVVGEMRSNYWSEVHSAIAGQIRYPSSARMRRMEGSVTVHISIDGNGDLQDVAARESSAQLFSRAVVAAVRRAAPYPAPPGALGDIINLELPVAFRLD